MGRRKRARKVIKTQKKPEVAKVFKCPFCSHEKSVECKMNRARKQATLLCKICGEKYEATINYLTDPIDVFCEWVDHEAEKDVEIDDGSDDQDRSDIELSNENQNVEEDSF